MCRPSELGPHEIGLWRTFQHSSLALQHPFLTPSFAHIYDDVCERTRVAVVHDGPGIAGFLPYELAGRSVARPLGGRLTNRQAFIHRPGFEWSWTDLIRGAGLSVFSFSDLVGEQLEGCRTMSPASTPIIDLTGGWEQYIKVARAHKSVRTTEAHARKMARVLGDVVFRVGRAPVAWLHQLTVWKSDQYRRTGFPDPFADPRLRPLLARLNDSGDPTLRPLFSTLTAGDRLVAADFSIATATVFAGWFAAFDTEFARFSPGSIRTLRVIEHACNEGIAQIDLSRGDEAYKSVLKNAEIDVATGFVDRPSVSAYAHRARTAPIAAASAYVLQRPRLRQFVRGSLRKVGAARVSLRP